MIAKKQKRDEVVVKQEVKEETNSDDAEHDKVFSTWVFSFSIYVLIFIEALGSYQYYV